MYVKPLSLVKHKFVCMYVCIPLAHYDSKNDFVCVLPIRLALTWLHTVCIYSETSHNRTLSGFTIFVRLWELKNKTLIK